MRCRLCKQEKSPIHKIIEKMASNEAITVLSSCAGYRYNGHQNIPERPFILFSVKTFGVLENLFQKVFSRLSVPTYLEYNGLKQFIFEVDLPYNWPDRDRLIEEVWRVVAERMEKF